MKVLDVYVNHHQTAADHVIDTINACSRSLSPPQILRSQGLVEDGLHTVFMATTQAKLLCCSSVWSRFCSVGNCKRLESFLQCSKRLCNYSSCTPTVDEPFKLVGESFFICILSNEEPILNALMPPRKIHAYNLRKRHHNRQLLDK